jgi:drug/metabolite transporter (DMT)-like permease
MRVRTIYASDLREVSRKIELKKDICVKNQTKAYFLTMMVVTFWATAASAFKIALGYVTPYTLLFFSILFSSIALLIIITVQGKLREVKKVESQSWLRLALLGFLNPFLYYVVLFKAYDILPGQIAMSLNYGWPLVLTLLSVPILKQSLSIGQLLTVSVSFLGAVIIATKGQFTSFGDVSSFGVLLAAGSTAIWATFWLFNAKNGRDPVVKLFQGFCFGLLYALIFGVLVGGIELPQKMAWLPLIYIGLFEMGITFVLWLTALQLTTAAARLGNLIYITPFFSLLILHLVVGEEIHPAVFGGLTLIVGSLLFQEIVSQKAEKNRGKITQ